MGIRLPFVLCIVVSLAGCGQSHRPATAPMPVKRTGKVNADYRVTYRQTDKSCSIPALNERSFEKLKGKIRVRWDGYDKYANASIDVDATEFGAFFERSLWPEGDGEFERAGAAAWRRHDGSVDLYLLKGAIRGDRIMATFAFLVVDERQIVCRWLWAVEGERIKR